MKEKKKAYKVLVEGQKQTDHKDNVNVSRKLCKGKGLGWYMLEQYNSAQGPVEGSCEISTEHLCPIKR
jgi:hypothetical protein